MCGIAGYHGEGLAPEEARPLLHAMAGALAHRGPDDEGIYCDDRAGLAHRRLSIVGLEDGQQPMASADGALHISFNGEIFNYLELRSELESTGWHARTGSDTEIILALYEREGADCLARLNGDFAFAIRDVRRQELFLARDRMGVRPLHYTWVDGRFYFASEIKSFLPVPGFRAELDPIALDQVFTLWSPIAPRTAFRGVSELPPGHSAHLKDGELRISCYWSLDYPDHDDLEPRSGDVLAEELRALLEDATRIRLRADVEVGAYLSGGLDSAGIAALAAPMARRGLSTFSIGFADASFDESAYQDEMVQALGTRHHRITCGNGDITEAFCEMIRHTEQPVLRTAPAPLYTLSGLVRQQGIKAVLTGEGADEIFAGYDIFREARVRRFCARRPGSHMRPQLFRRIYPYLRSLQRQTPSYLEAYFGIGTDAPDDPLYSHRPRLRGTAGAKLFFSAALRRELADYDAADELVSLLPERFSRWHPLHQAQYLETRFLMPGYILSAQGDRMAMAHGVETRFPFLDHRLVEFAASLPPGVKLSGLREKQILRRALRDIVPQSILDRPKQPYRAPDSAAFAQAMPEAATAALAPEALMEAGLFNVPATGKLVAKVCRGAATSFRDNAAFIGILSTQIWCRSFRQMHTQDAAHTPRKARTP